MLELCHLILRYQQFRSLHLFKRPRRLPPVSTQKRVLVIDDDPDAVYLLQENLDRQEFEITVARNGQDGLRLARERRPQAILLDILMPGMDGWQVLHDLKEDPATASIPVILLTIIDKKALGFRLGAAAYLLKPLDPVAVRDTLNRVIGAALPPQKHVLVVDDDPNVADMLRQFLPESEFRLDSALAAMLALGYVTKYSGTDATLGLALATTGSLYPFFGTTLGWLGVALGLSAVLWRAGLWHYSAVGG